VVLIGIASACSESDPAQAQTSASPAQEAPAKEPPAADAPPPVDVEAAGSTTSEVAERTALTGVGEGDAQLPVVSRRWLGDLDALEEQRVIRVLTVYGPGRFHLEEGRGQGIVAEMTTRYEKHLNDNLGRGHVKVYTVVVPLARDQLVPALLDGRGDLIMAGMTITD
ncbi:unnamed protein product, partial [Ectocarpus sp. 12 AP-2014]